VVPLTSQGNGRHAWKVLIPPEPGEPEMRTHEGFEWLYVLSGKLRLILGGCDITLNAGEVAEFDQVGLTASSRWQAAWGGAGVTMGK
jgi:Cupin domain